MKKEKFIEEIKRLISEGLTLSEDAQNYFDALCISADTEEKKTLTDNGKKVLKFMQENKDNFNNLFTSKAMGEAMGIPSRTVSGSMRGLLNAGYIEKMSEKPVVYAITEFGLSQDISEE